MLISLLILDNFDSHDLLGFVVKALESLAKTAFSKEILNFKPIRKMVFQDDLIIAILIVIAIVVVFAWLSSYLF